MASSRRLLDRAGYYGTRAVVHEGPADRLPYPDFFANLIVSERTLVTGALPGSVLEAFRVLRPCGGVLWIGQLADAAAGPGRLSETALTEWLRPLALPADVVRKNEGLWAIVERGAIPGSGEWTQLYANAGNTACSGDMLRGPLRLQWFGEPGPRNIIDRHHRPMSPL